MSATGRITLGSSVWHLAEVGLTVHTERFAPFGSVRVSILLPSRPGQVIHKSGAGGAATGAGPGRRGKRASADVWAFTYRTSIPR